MTSIPMSKLHLQVAVGLLNEGFITAVRRGDLQGPDTQFTPTTYDNISTRRIWLELKYRNFRSVLNRIHLISHPNRRVIATPDEMLHLCTGRPFRKVQPLELGEVIFVRVQDSKDSKETSVYEIHEAVDKNLSGELLLRAS